MLVTQVTRIICCVFGFNLLATVRSMHSSQPKSHIKVHNLSLYPEKNSWCKATPIQQEISHTPECEPVTINNKVCLGACFSYSVPKAQDHEPIAPYCDKCDKIMTSWTVVTLNCTDLHSGDRYQHTKNVELITHCTCVDCETGELRKKPSVKIDKNFESYEDFGSESLENDDGNYIEDSLEEEVDTIEHNHLEDDVRLPSRILMLDKLKGTKADPKEVEEVLEKYMIAENKIPSDDDHDPDVRKDIERTMAAVHDP